MRVSVAKLVLIFAVIAGIGLAAVVAVSNLALNDLRVGGPLYTKIKLGNDLVADILPPPEYVIEAYLESTLAMRDPSTVAGRRARLAELRKEYGDRREFWRKSELNSALKQKLIEQSDAHVQRFWSASEKQLPALERGDAAAAEKAYAELTAAYTAHRAVIDEIVKSANDGNAVLEGEASARVTWFQIAVWTISAIVCLVIGVGLAGIILGVVRPIGRLTATMRGLADGDLTASIPFLTRRDEIGLMATATQVFRDNAVKVQQNDRHLLELGATAEKERRDALIEMCEILEADLDGAVAEVLTISNDAAQRGEQSALDAQAIASEACQLAAASEQATGNVTSVSAATEELSAAGREIAKRAVEMARFAQNAVDESRQASATVASLNEAAARIGNVVNLISEVASQTNLLALNATIEAARAGEAGKGFAVVAQEVKALSRKTSDAADDISHRIQDICRATEDSVGVIGRIGTTVAGIEELTGAVASAAEQQEATLLEVARSLSEASEGVATVSLNVSKISDRSVEIESQARLVSGLVHGTNRRVSQLRGNMVASLRSSSAGDRRSLENRRPVSVPARLRCGKSTIDGTILDLSEGGLRFRAAAGQTGASERTAVVVQTSAFGDVDGTIIAVGEIDVHICFADLSEPRRQAVLAMLRSVDETDRRFVSAAREAASRIGEAFEAAIASGAVAQSDLFDTQYRPIAGTDPQQFETAFTALCDRVLPPIQEPLLDLDPRVVFCAAVDKNAFLPTHNRKFSQPPRAGDPVWNAANSRNRRFFKDSAGIRAARTTREFLLQTYDRDMGGGAVVTLKEVDVPIRIGGRHWGGLRLAFKA